MEGLVWVVEVDVVVWMENRTATITEGVVGLVGIVWVETSKTRFYKLPAEEFLKNKQNEVLQTTCHKV